LYQWWYQYHTVSPVAFGSTKLAYASIPPDQLRFADFNGDGKTDVFVLVQQQSTNPTLMLQLNQTSVQPGQTLIATATLAPGDTSQAVDAYIVILLPTGQFFSLQLGGGLVPGIVPLAAGFTPFPVTQAVFAYTFTGTEPPGPYTFFTGLTVAGSSPLSLIGSIDEDTFTFSP
jgi:hypothetical protein